LARSALTPSIPARLTQGSLVNMSPPLTRQRSCHFCATSGKSACAIRASSFNERVETVVVLAIELELAIDVELSCKPVGSGLVEFTADETVELSAEDTFVKGSVVFERSGNVVTLDGVEISAAQAGGESTRLCKM